MANNDTAPNAQASPRLDTLIVHTEMQALKHLGWIQPIDYVMTFLVVMCWFTVIAWKIFGQPTPWNILCCVITAFGLVQFWLVLLIFRCSHFVLLIKAYLNDLPYEAARIVMSAYAGGQGTPTPPSSAPGRRGP